MASRIAGSTDLDVDLLRRELLHVQNDLEVVLVGLDRGESAVLLAAHEFAPGPVIMIVSTASMGHHASVVVRGPRLEDVRRHDGKVFRVQTYPEVLVAYMMGMLEFLPPVGEEKREKRHD